jgi:tRNA(adenine34) deaminase
MTPANIIRSAVPQDIVKFASLMAEAIAEARLAGMAGEVPIGCVVYHDPTGEVIGRGSNRRARDSDPTAHAEIVALRQAGQRRGDWRLEDCTLIVTLEPCPMCAGAIVNARISSVVYGCTDPKAGAVQSLFQLCSDARLNHRAQVTGGILALECAALLKEFFAAQRALGKK